MIGLLGSWERLFSPVEYPHIIVKLVPHTYQRVIDLAFSSFPMSRLPFGFQKIEAVTSVGSRGFHPGCYRTRGSVSRLPFIGSSQHRKHAEDPYDI